MNTEERHTNTNWRRVGVCTDTETNRKESR